MEQEIKQQGAPPPPPPPPGPAKPIDTDRFNGATIVVGVINVPTHMIQLKIKLNYGSLSGYTVYRFNNVACKTTGTILPGFSMFLRNYDMFSDFKSAEVAKRLGLRLLG